MTETSSEIVTKLNCIDVSNMWLQFLCRNFNISDYCYPRGGQMFANEKYSRSYSCFNQIVWKFYHAIFQCCRKYGKHKFMFLVFITWIFAFINYTTSPLSFTRCIGKMGESDENYHYSITIITDYYFSSPCHYIYKAIII